MAVNVAKTGVLDRLADKHMAQELGVDEAEYRKVKARKAAPSAGMIAAMRIRFQMPLERWTDVFNSIEDAA